MRSVEDLEHRGGQPLAHERLGNDVHGGARARHAKNGVLGHAAIAFVDDKAARKSDPGAGLRPAPSDRDRPVPQLHVELAVELDEAADVVDRGPLPPGGPEIQRGRVPGMNERHEEVWGIECVNSGGLEHGRESFALPGLQLRESPLSPRRSPVNKCARSYPARVARIPVNERLAGLEPEVAQRVQAAEIRLRSVESFDLAAKPIVGHPVVVIEMGDDLAGRRVAGCVPLGAERSPSGQPHIFEPVVAGQQVTDCPLAVINHDELLVGVVLAQEVPDGLLDELRAVPGRHDAADKRRVIHRLDRHGRTSMPSRESLRRYRHVTAQMQPSQMRPKRALRCPATARGRGRFEGARGSGRTAGSPRTCCLRRGGRRSRLGGRSPAAVHC